MPLSPSGSDPISGGSPRPGPRNNSGFWKGAAFLGLFLLGVSLLAHVAFWFDLPGAGLSARAATKDSSLEEVILKEGKGLHKIAVVDVSGIISGDPIDHQGQRLVESVEHQLSRCASDASVRAVILKIDSPGGEVLASDDLSRLLAKFQVKHAKPVVASMGSVAASGGYYIAAPCQWIVANELTVTGSIGVIMHAYNYRGLMDKVGVRPEVYKSGRFKDMLSGDKRENEISTEEKEMVQNMINETFGRFKQVVQEGRNNAALKNKGNGRSLAADWGLYADGRILTGKQAFESGFIDELGNFDTAVERAEKIAGIEEATLVTFQHVYSLSSLLRLFGQGEARHAVKLDLGLDIPDLKVGRPYFLWMP